VLADSGHTFAATATGVGPLTSADLGRTWTGLGAFPGSGLAIGLAASPRHPDTLVLVTERDPRMFLTTDRGDSWVSHRIADRFEPRGIAYHPLGADTLFAWGGVRDSVTGPTRFAVYRSTNSGQSWFMATSRTGAGLCHGFWIAPGAETLYAWGTANNGPVISRSADRGRNWTGIASGISGPVVRGFAASTADTGLLYCAATGGIFRSRNRGGNWTRVGLTMASAVLPDPADTARIMAATDTQGVYLTTDAGRTWQRDTIALTGRTGLMFRRHPDAPTAVYLSAAGASLLGHGLIAIEEPRPAAPLSGIGVTPSVVNRSARFSAARLVGPAALKLYHADGRLACAVGTLDRIQPVLDWRRPAQLPAGVYLLELSGPDQRDLTKLILTP
jgi:photosystem II stability/assembly factor-like uncharacterized protein